MIVPVATALGENSSTVSISRSTLQRLRKQHRKEHGDQVKKAFDPNDAVVVHWDGKLLPDITGSNIVERLPVIVSGNGNEKLLGVPKLLSGTGKNGSDAIFRLLQEWGTVDNIKAMYFDTTAVNTGRMNGVAILLEKKIGRDLLWLVCRHHMYEIMLSKAFLICFGPTSSPETGLFKRFKAAWNKVDKNNYKELEITPNLKKFQE